MSDLVYITALKVETLIGVYEFERHAPQVLFLDITLDHDCRRAGETDDLNYALDYDRLARTVRDWAGKQSFELIETFAEQLCQLIHLEFSVPRVQLGINKPAAVADCAGVGIRIERTFSK